MTEWLEPNRIDMPLVGDSRLRVPAIMLSCVAIGLFAGCGGSSATARQTAQTRFVALANALCRESSNPRVSGAWILAHRNGELARLRALASSARSAPRLAAYISDLAAQRRLLAPLAKLKLPAVINHSGADTNSNLVLEAYRLAVRVHADEKALGLTSCMGPSPRPPIGG